MIRSKAAVKESTFLREYTGSLIVPRDYHYFVCCSQTTDRKMVQKNVGHTLGDWVISLAVLIYKGFRDLFFFPSSFSRSFVVFPYRLAIQTGVARREVNKGKRFDRIHAFT